MLDTTPNMSADLQALKAGFKFKDKGLSQIEIRAKLKAEAPIVLSAEQAGAKKTTPETPEQLATRLEARRREIKAAANERARHNKTPNELAREARRRDQELSQIEQIRANINDIPDVPPNLPPRAATPMKRSDLKDIVDRHDRKTLN